MFEMILCPADFTSEVLPVGEGILSCFDLKGVCAAIDAVEADYPRNAQEYADSDRVLCHLVERAMETVS
jgi:hypothetical protein